MKNKGFTLTEIIVVIGLLAVIGTIIAVNLTNILANEDETDYNDFVKLVENAGCSYIELNASSGIKTSCKNNSGGCNITLNNIILTGLLREDLVNPRTKNAINQENSTVNIKWVNNEKKCTYNYIERSDN